MEKGSIVLKFSNRFFLDDGVADNDVPISDTIDLLHILRNQMTSYARHTADNKVLYFEKVTLQRLASDLNIRTLLSDTTH